MKLWRHELKNQLLILDQHWAQAFYLLLLGFTGLFNILGHQRRFRHRAWKVRQILLRGSNFGLRFFYLPLIYDMGPTDLLPFRRKSYSGFLHSEKNPSTPAGIEPANLRSRGEYDNHWTTGVDVFNLLAIIRLPVAVYDGCVSVAFVYWLRLKQFVVPMNAQSHLWLWHFGSYLGYGDA